MDYYKELGLQKNASKSEIKAAYRKMAQKYHPDSNVINKQYLMNCIEFILNSKYRIEILSVRPD